VQCLGVNFKLWTALKKMNKDIQMNLQHYYYE